MMTDFTDDWGVASTDKCETQQLNRSAESSSSEWGGESTIVWSLESDQIPNQNAPFQQPISHGRGMRGGGRGFGDMSSRARIGYVQRFTSDDCTFQSNGFHKNQPRSPPMFPIAVIPANTIKKCTVTLVQSLQELYILPIEDKARIQEISQLLKSMPFEEKRIVRGPGKEGWLVRFDYNGTWYRGVCLDSRGNILLVDEGKIISRQGRQLFFMPRGCEADRLTCVAVKSSLSDRHISTNTLKSIRQRLEGKDFFVTFHGLQENRYTVSLHDLHPPIGIDSLIAPIISTEIPKFSINETYELVNIERKDDVYIGRLKGYKETLNSLYYEYRSRWTEITPQQKKQIRCDCFSLKTGTAVIRIYKNKVGACRGVITQETSDGISVEVLFFDSSTTSVVKIDDLYPLIEPFASAPPQCMTFQIERELDLSPDLCVKVTIGSIADDGIVTASSFESVIDVKQQPKNMLNPDEITFSSLDDDEDKENKNIDLEHLSDEQISNQKSRDRITAAQFFDMVSLSPQKTLSVVSEEDSFLITEEELGIVHEQDESNIKCQNSITEVVVEIVNKLVSDVTEGMHQSSSEMEVPNKKSCNVDEDINKSRSDSNSSETNLSTSTFDLDEILLTSYNRRGSGSAPPTPFDTVEAINLTLDPLAEDLPETEQCVPNVPSGDLIAFDA